jgi:hypothetical protein
MKIHIKSLTITFIVHQCLLESLRGSGQGTVLLLRIKLYVFADKSRHQLFLEPEGLNTEEVYVQGLSTSLPEDVQVDVLHSIAGLEKS